MKKLVTMLMVALTVSGAAMLMGCGGSDSNDNPTNALTGTTWDMTRSDGVQGVFNFSTSSNVSLTCAMGTGYGTYTFANSNVAFAVIMNGQVRFDIQGVVSGNNMNGNCTVAPLDGSDVSSHSFVGTKR